MIVRPDIAFAVQHAVWATKNPTNANWTTVIRILQYLAGIYTHGLVYKPARSISVHGYCNANWAAEDKDK